MEPRPEISICWLRRDLRLYDHNALFYALQENTPVLPIFIFDIEILDLLEDKKDARLAFIHQTISQLHKQLEQLGSTLLVLHGKPIDIYKTLLSSYTIKSVYANRDYEPYAIARDQAVEALLAKHQVGFYTFKDHVIFEKREILTDGGEPYKVFTPYSRKWKDALAKLQLEPLKPNLNNLAKHPPSTVPSLADLGFEPSEIQTPPAEFVQKIISTYDQQRDFPAIEGTTRLGIHLRHGTISIREAVAIARQWNQTWLNELIWRDFYVMILSNYPQVVNKAFKPAYDHIPWRNNATEFEAWCKGITGFPIVDAGMRQLNKTGYMHNRVRMIVASFLTKHLLIDWRWGEAYFAKKLLDFELASNNGGWQWAAGTGTDAQPYFRVFNPDSQTQKFDKELRYIKYWVPELGTPRYPQPLVDYKMARARAIATYKNALAGFAEDQ